MKIRELIRKIANRIRLFGYRIFIRTIIESHEYRVEKIKEYIVLSKELYDEYVDNKYKREVAQHSNEIRSLDKKLRRQQIELQAKKNSLIDTIMKCNKVFNIKQKGTEIPIDEEYLKQFDITSLINLAETILKQIEKLDL